VDEEFKALLEYVEQGLVGKVVIGRIKGLKNLMNT